MIKTVAATSTNLSHILAICLREDSLIKCLYSDTYKYLFLFLYYYKLFLFL